MRNPSLCGTLYVVATPIGNLDDMTFRAVSILKQVDFIAAEDTRHSKKLLNHYGIDTRLISCHEHNEADKAPLFISHLKNGQNIALISDAGTPTISDPGYHLVREAAKEKIPVIPIPGCCAAMAGLSVSGLPTDTFYFAGFLPKKKEKLRQAIEFLKDMKATLVFYESPKRITSLIEIMVQILGNREAALAREITKLHEEYMRGSLSEILGLLNGKESIKGECSLFVQGCRVEEVVINEEMLEKIVYERVSSAECGTSELSRHISKEFNLNKKQAYDLILRIKKKKAKQTLRPFDNRI